MRLKTVPTDFVVIEQLSQALRGAGPWAVYRLQKVNRTTVEVQTRLAREVNLPRAKVIFPALKDKNAATMQHLSLPAGLSGTLSGEGFKAERIGYLDRPLTPSDLAGNRFSMCLRDLDLLEVERLREVVSQLSRSGMPNYFDQQRFGSYVEGWGFIGKTILQRDAEGAIYAYLCRPFVGDPRAVSRFKEQSRKLWPDWTAMMAEAPRPSNFRSVLTYLIDHPEGYRKALNLIPQRLLSIYLSAYQSYLWNSIAAELIFEMTGVAENSNPFVEIAGERLPLYQQLSDRTGSQWRDYRLPLPSHAARYGRIKPLVDELLSSEGFVLNDLKARILKTAYVTKNERAILVFPRHVSAGTADTDERFPGRHKVQVAFDLPRGSYATLVIRVVATLADVSLA